MQISVVTEWRDVYDRAVGLLARRPWAEAELRARLLSGARGGSPDAVAAALARCRELGYLDDDAFARALARGRLDGAGQGPWRVQRELESRGVSASLARQALDEALGARDPVDLAAAALVRRYGAGGCTDRKQLKKRYDFLLRRGFSHEQAWAALVREGSGDGEEPTS
ncbi:MAG: RecX family transcriptional regulator [Magnetococcus sp. WYHC-3]